MITRVVAAGFEAGRNQATAREFARPAVPEPAPDAEPEIAQPGVEVDSPPEHEQVGPRETTEEPVEVAGGVSGGERPEDSPE